MPKAAVTWLKNTNFISFCLIFFFIIQLVVFSWTINRGFDFSDEAFGYLGFSDTREVSQTATFYTLVYNLFFGWVGISIIKVRIIRMILLLACTAVFATGLIKWLKRKTGISGAEQTNLFIFLLLGSFTINANGSQSLTYNLFSTFLFLLITGLFLYTFQRGSAMGRRDSAIFFLIGAMLFALFAVKFSNAVFLGAALFGLLIYDKQEIKPIVVCVTMTLLGAVVFWLLLFQSEALTWVYDYYKTLTTLNDRTNAAILTRYVEDYRNVSDNLIIANAKWIVLSVALLLTSRFVENRLIKILIAASFAAILIYITYDKIFFMGGYRYIYVVTFFYLFVNFVLLTAFVGIAAIDVVRPKGISLSFVLVVILTLLIPFFGSIGTNNLLSVHFIWYAPFLFALTFLLLHIHGTIALNVIILVVAVNGMIQAVSGLVYHPYRIKGTLFEQSVRMKPVGENVLLDKDLKEAVTSANNMIRTKTNFQQGDPVFSFRSEFGFIYFLKGTLPGWNWYREETPELNCRHFQKSKAKKLDRTIFILPKNYTMDSVFMSCLQKSNIDFSLYVKLGEIPYVFDGVERPLSVHVPPQILKN